MPYANLGHGPHRHVEALGAEALPQAVERVDLVEEDAGRVGVAPAEVGAELLPAVVEPRRLRISPGTPILTLWQNR